MKSCAFFGHRDVDYAPYMVRIKREMRGLVENEGVTRFFSGDRGYFDNVCTRAAFELKCEYPQLRNVLVLSYHPDKNFELPKIYDESVYLLDRAVPPLYAIVETNKAIVDASDFVIAGIKADFGGAYEAVAYAKRKKIIDICGYFS